MYQWRLANGTISRMSRTRLEGRTCVPKRWQLQQCGLDLKPWTVSGQLGCSFSFSVWLNWLKIWETTDSLVLWLYKKICHCLGHCVSLLLSCALDPFSYAFSPASLPRQPFPHQPWPPFVRSGGGFCPRFPWPLSSLSITDHSSCTPFYSASPFCLLLVLLKHWHASGLRWIQSFQEESYPILKL